MMTPEVWIKIVGLSLEGLMVNQKDLKDVVVKFNKVTKYKALIEESFHLHCCCHQREAQGKIWH